MMRRWLPLAAFAALAALLLAGVLMNSGKDKSAIASPLIGKPVPEFSLPLLDEPDKRLGRADFIGKPWLLNVWGSWCVNCRDEHPQLLALARSGRIAIVGYNYKDETAEAQRWLQSYGSPYSVVLADEEGRAALDFGIYGAPETFLVDSQGIVRWKHVGPITDEVLQQELEPLFAQVGVPAAGASP
jgi:cytochrome c biogenesis protein CcmG/thiol:disulfide interchange protein DsbE